MAAENQIQFFEAPFQYSIWEFSSNVNLSYHKLINTRPIKLPFMNTWFETPFSQSYAEKWDKSYFAIRKREWFKKCDILDWFIRDTIKEIEWQSADTDYFITDHQIIDWIRFLMVINIPMTKMYIFYQKPWIHVNCQLTPQNVCQWSWEFLQKYYTTPCSYHKFQKITTLQSNETRLVNWFYIWNIVVDWWATTAVLFNESRTAIEWIKTWDFIQVQSSLDWDVVVWQALQVWQFDAEHWWYNMWYWSWIWIIDKNTEEIKDDKWEKIWDLWYMWQIDWQLYDWAKLWIAFAWLDQNDNWYIYEWDWVKFAKLRQTQLPNANITSLTEDMDWLIFTTDKWVINFLRQHSDAWQSNWWTIYSTNPLYWWWDVAKSCWDYVFLFWPNTMWIAYKNWTDDHWDFRWNVQILDRNMWYFSKDSILVFNEWLYMVDNKKRFVKLDVEVTTDSYYRPSFKLQVTDMSLHWINTDLRNLDAERWDRVALCKDTVRIYIIIQDSMDSNDDWHEVVNTKILVYEDELKYRHRWYLCNVDIRWYHWWEWFWRWLWLTEWDKDNWKFFKQIISLTFWDTSWFTRKELLWIKAAVWYHSKISKNTVLSIRTDWWWFSKTIKMDTLHKVSYIQAINALSWSWKTDIDNLQTLYRAMPIGIWIYAWNWVWLIKDIYRTARKEFDSYCNYEDVDPAYYINTCCDPKPGSEPSDNGCTMKAPDADKENFRSDRFQYHYNVAKFATLPIDVWQQWQNFYIELVANNWDSIEFLWFMIWRMFMDNNFDSIANKPFYDTTPKDSLPWMIWK